jgi:hypothetical protein
VFHHGHFRGSDEVGLLQVARSLHDGPTLAVPRIVHTGEGADGRFYSHFSLGQSALAVPFIAAGRGAAAVLPEAAVRAIAGPDLRTRVLRFGGSIDIFAAGFYAPTIGALLVALFFLFQRRLGVARGTALVCALLFGATTYVACQSTFFLRHTSETLCLLAALYGFHVWQVDGRRLHLALGAAAASLAFLVRLPAAVGGPVIGGYLIACLWIRGGRRFDPALIRAALVPVLAPLLIALAISAGGDYLKWGALWNIHQLRTASSQSTPILVSLPAALVSPGMSVFVYSPLLLLAPWCVPALWRRHRPEALAFLALALSFLVAFSSFTGWTGLWSSPGPRYQVISIALLLLPLGLWLDDSPDGAARRRRWIAIGALAALGLVVQIGLMSVRWGAVIEVFGLREFRPKVSFLFDPAYSPVLLSLRLLFRGGHLDLWLWQLARGAEGIPPAPGAAAALLALWGLMLAASVAWLLRALRRGG